MNDKQLDDLLKKATSATTPAATPDAKSRAINLAMEAFAKEQTEQLVHLDNETEESGSEKSYQGIGYWLRLMSNATSNSFKRFFMDTNTNPLLYKTLAGGACVVLALGVILNLAPTQLRRDNVVLKETNNPYDELSYIDSADFDTTPAQSSDSNTLADSSRLESGQLTEKSASSTLAEESSSGAMRSQPAIPTEESPAAVSSTFALEPSVNNTAASKPKLRQEKISHPQILAKKKAVERPRKIESVDELIEHETKDTGIAANEELRIESDSKLIGSSITGQHSDTIADLSVSHMPETQAIVIDQRSQQQRKDHSDFTPIKDNSVKLVSSEPVSTFSIDVDTASYSFVRKQLKNGYLPTKDAVRAEELINYFDYNYPLPESRHQPFQPTITLLPSPWNEQKKLLHIGIKGYELEQGNAPDSNLVFLLDVSGSMGNSNKLPLVKQSIKLLLDTLKPTDSISIVVYAGAAGVVLEPTRVQDKSTIISALNRLSAGGSTAGGAGIELAYQLAEQNFSKQAINRVILATDGDFNIGMTSNEDLKTYIERKRNNGIFLSVLGFGTNNYQDDLMQTLAQNGNGVAAYIDSLSEAKKVLVDEATSMLFPIAKDVKIQIEFNPEKVSEYRLIGYETRALNREDFNNDKVDAGDIGAGHTVTAIYEITPHGASQRSIDEPRYSANKKQVEQVFDNASEYGFLKIRYKLPDQSNSRLLTQAIVDTQNSETGNGEIRFSIAVAGFAQLLRGGMYLSNQYNYDNVIQQAQRHKGHDEFGHRSEFIQLVRMAKIAQP